MQKKQESQALSLNYIVLMMSIIFGFWPSVFQLMNISFPVTSGQADKGYEPLLFISFAVGALGFYWFVKQSIQESVRNKALAVLCGIGFFIGASTLFIFSTFAA